MLVEKDLNKLIRILNVNEIHKFKFEEDYKKIYSLDQMNSDINFQNLVYPYIRLNNHKNTTTRLDFIEKTNNKHLNNLETKLSLKSILYRLAKGDTLIMDGIDVFNQNVRTFSRVLSNGLNAKVSSNLYYTFRDNTGINLHFDQHDVLAIQIHGQKKWHFVRNIIEDASQKIDHSIKPILDSDSVVIETILLEEGEFLFIPKGIWHYTETTAEKSSLHIAFGLIPPNINDVLNEFIRQKIGKYGQKNVYSLDEKKYQSVVEELISKLNDSVDEKLNSIEFSNFLKIYKNQYTNIELI